MIEILVVVAILGVLASIVAINVWTAHQQAMLETCKLSVDKAAEGVELFRLRFRRYPTTEEGLGILEHPPTGLPIRINREDPWGQHFRYRFPGQLRPGRFELWSVGPDSADGTDDDIRAEG